MDATYKTNAHLMPLLRVVGVTGTHNLFTVGCCFMDNETETSYLWALKRLQRSLARPPSVVVVDDETALINALAAFWPSCQVHLCRWHISKNIKTYCFKSRMQSDAFKALMKGWHIVCNLTRTEDEFAAKWEAVKQDLIESVQEKEYTWLHSPRDERTIQCLHEAFIYIDRNKIPQRDRFASFAINRFRHFAHTSTSIAEGAHWTNIKSHLKRARGSLLEVYDRIER